MILIGPGALLLLVLLMFKPVRMVFGFVLFVALCFVAAFVVFAMRRNGVI